MDNRVAIVIERILHIPRDFHLTQTKSWNTLLNESGYFEVHDQINEDEIMQILKRCPHLIPEWLQWSDDQRCTPTWYFKKGEDGKCFVGHYPEDQNFKEMNTLDEFKACSYFIKNLVEGSRMFLYE